MHRDRPDGNYWDVYNTFTPKSPEVQKQKFELEINDLSLVVLVEFLKADKLI